MNARTDSPPQGGVANLTRARTLMACLRGTAKRIPVCLATLLLPALLAQAQMPPVSGAVTKEELERQQRLIQQRGEARYEGYVIDRSLKAYESALSPDFLLSLYTLGPRDRWLDIGAGRGMAVLDYYTPVPGELPGRLRARSVAMSIEDRRTDDWHRTAARLQPGQIEYLHGKYLREFSAKDLGRFQLITDVIGGFSYTTELSLFMDRVLSLLELQGVFYTVLQDVYSEAGTHAPFYPGSPYLTELRDANGMELKVCTWLKRISCVEVTCEVKPSWKPPVEAYRVRKVCDNTVVPALTPTRFQAGTPPEREFRVSAPAPAAAVVPAATR